MEPHYITFMATAKDTIFPHDFEDQTYRLKFTKFTQLECSISQLKDMTFLCDAQLQIYLPPGTSAKIITTYNLSDLQIESEQLNGPAWHPIQIRVKTNRSLDALKLGLNQVIAPLLKIISV